MSKPRGQFARSQLRRTSNEGFAQTAAAMDALAVQLDCARVGLVDDAVSRGWWTSRRALRPLTG